MATILICTDHSKSSQFALEYYLQYVHHAGNKVKVLHVPDYFAKAKPMSGGPTPGRVHELIVETHKNTEEIKKCTMGICSNAGVNAEFLVEHGPHAWQVVTKVAERMAANLIVVGSRGLNTVKRALLGSVSDSVVHHALCPVLICRKPAETVL